MLEASLQEATEDQLGAAPIRPGDSVIIFLRFSVRKINPGGTTVRFIVPDIAVCNAGTFLSCWKSKAFQYNKMQGGRNRIVILFGRGVCSLNQSMSD